MLFMMQPSRTETLSISHAMSCDLYLCARDDIIIIMMMSLAHTVERWDFG